MRRLYIILASIARKSPCSLSNVRSTHSTILRTNFDPSDYSKLPPSPPVDKVFLLDPLIATGGTACAALAMIVDWGISGKGLMCFTRVGGWLCVRYAVKDIKLLCVLASKEGLNHVQAEFPELEVCSHTSFIARAPIPGREIDLGCRCWRYPDPRGNY